jgi:hypothetical protein
MSTLRRNRRWQKQDFLFEQDTSIWTKSFKGENVFIKENIPRDIDTASGNIKILDTFMKRTISKKHTLLGAEGEFACVVRTKIWPTSTAKGAKSIIVWFEMKEAFSR